ncbi:T-complex protein 1 subunit beta [Geothlypis trichas]
MGGDTFPSARMLRVPSSLALGPARDGARTLSAGSLFQRKEFPSRRAPRHGAQPSPRGGAAALRAAGAGPDCGSQQAARAGSGGRSDAIPGELVGLRRGFCAEGGRAAAPGGTGTMASLSLAPVNIFKAGADEEKAETARLSSFVGAIAIGDLVKSTLGPKGMDKILLSTGRDSSVTVTNDGATILKAIGVDNPAAKVLVDMSKVQDDEVGDGTTSVTVLAAELLREAELLIARKIHPQTIIAGWRAATKASREALLKAAVDHGNDEVKFREDLMNIAGTTLSSKLLTHHKDHFVKLAVEAVLRLKGSGNLEAIHVIKKLGGSLADSYLDEGFLLDKKIGVNQPKRIENAKILIANTGMDTDKIKIFGSRVRVDSTAKVAEIEQAEKEKMKEKVDRILKHGINCFINRQLIYNYPEHLFGAAGVMAIEHADFAGVERLALVTGGEIASTFDHPELVKLGSCKLIEEVMIGEDKLIHFSGVAMGEACTIVLRGATQQILDEAERSLHDALCVLAQTVKDTRTVYGGGCSEMLMANAVAELAVRTPGKESVAMESFAKALRMIPTIIADNAGYDSADLVAQLRAAHSEGKTTYGLDMKEGVIGDMSVLGVTESFQVKRQVLLSAAEAAEMILRVDDIIKAAPRKRVPDHRPC